MSCGPDEGDLKAASCVQIPAVSSPANTFAGGGDTSAKGGASKWAVDLMQ